MAIKIKFDQSYNAMSPTFVLATRNGNRIGAIPAYRIIMKGTMNNGFELTFNVNKRDCVEHVWENLVDFKLLWAKEWNVFFEVYVEINESNKISKNVTAKSLGEAELSQINLYGIEINTEDDIAREDYEPAVLYDDTDKNKSLLTRILEKAPHYTIKHVDQSIKNIQRTFKFDDISIYDAFKEIQEEIQCLISIDCFCDFDGNLVREISAYDLESYCLQCGERGDFLDKCSKCGSTNILHGYGEDTSIFVSSDNLANEITYTTDTGSVKNCFRLQAGDDLMTATIANCNPNGTGYIWYLSDEVTSDMSRELADKIRNYNDEYDYYQNSHQIYIDQNVVTAYNNLVTKYSIFTDQFHTIENPIVGYPALMEAYYNVIDLHLYLKHGLMPSGSMSDTTAAIEVTKLVPANLSPVSVQNLYACSAATAENAVLSMAKTIVDGRYRVQVSNTVFSNNTWSGIFVVTNYSDEEDTATSGNISVVINDDYEGYVRQKIDKTLSKSITDNDYIDIVSLFNLSDDIFINELKKYSLSKLTSFENICQSCIDILIQQGITDLDFWSREDQDLYESMFIPYHNKLIYIRSEINVRESEINVITGTYDVDDSLLMDGIENCIERYLEEIQDTLNFENYIGTTLMTEFAAYRREDTYKNDNYISEGLDNAELFRLANEFLETARKEIFKSATLQHSITATLKNLLVMKEFEKIVDYFEIGNWIRIRVDERVFRLRLLEYEIDFDDLENLEITFSDVMIIADGTSDVKSILDKAASMATSYNYVSRQASRGEKGNRQLVDWATNGLSLTKMKIVDSADNQNITWDDHGLLCREYLPFTDTYDDKQLKIINRGLYLTDDNWETSRAGIGDFVFFNPETGQMENRYGVIADTLVSSLILSEKVGIYNEQSSVVIDENGIVITTNGTGNEENQLAFTIQRKTIDGEDNESLESIMYIDSNGSLVLNGQIRINASTDETISTIDDLADTNRFNEVINEAIHLESQNIYASIDERYTEIIRETTYQLEQYKSDIGQYMQFDEDGMTLGAITSEFKTTIDNRGMYFKQGNTIVSYVNNNQLYIPNAVIQQTLMFGNFFISPRADGGASLTWQD